MNRCRPDALQVAGDGGMLDPYPDGTGQTVSIHQLQRSRKSFGTADASGRLRRQNDHLQVFTDSGVRTIVCRSSQAAASERSSAGFCFLRIENFALTLIHLRRELLGNK